MLFAKLHHIKGIGTNEDDFENIFQDLMIIPKEELQIYSW